jgi:hypothetical protein
MEDLMNKTVVVNKKLVNWKLIDQEVVFLHNKEKFFYELNETATYIWLSANGGKTVSDIVKGLISKFAVNKATAEKETIAFIKEAIKNKIFIFG